jgi:predicted N-formylglutamate amidohydrolase
MLEPDEPPAFEVVNPSGRARAVVLCDHASNLLPRALGDMGLAPERLGEHIAWDLGAALVARRLAGQLDAPLVLSGYSRLVIDCNRPPGAPTSIVEVSAGVVIPGNGALPEDAARARAEAFFWPYHRAIEGILAERERAGLVETAILSVHSFTPEPLRGPRPWHAGMMYGGDRRLAGLMLEALSRDKSLVIGDNEPYQVTDASDYGVPVYAERAGRPGVLIEIRQDLIATREAADRWGDRLADAFTSIHARLWG